ncbi:hypothetical protein M9Y10_044871 [Tritrichomonas musculus]|uniref:Uncharacterized protein n=1 Tax=Tritrichomonas musculus TaxID=1915356 RepID=A0ABR2JWK1_9EUKA
MADEQNSAIADIDPAQTDDKALASQNLNENENDQDITIQNENQIDQNSPNNNKDEDEASSSISTNPSPENTKNSESSEKNESSQTEIQLPDDNTQKDEDFIPNSNDAINEDKNKNNNSQLELQADIPETEKDNALQHPSSENLSKGEKTNEESNEEKNNDHAIGIISQHKSDAQILKPVLNQPPISVFNIPQPINSNNNNNLNDSGQNNDQSMLRSLPTNVITAEQGSSEASKSGPQIFHRHISITNNNNSPLSPIQQHFSVPVISVHNNSVLSMSSAPKPIVPVIATNNPLSSNSTPNPISNTETSTRKHHHHHHHRRHQKEQEQEQEPDIDDQDFYTTSPKSALLIPPRDLQEFLSREDDEPELDLTPQTSAILDTIKKTGKLRFNLPSSTATVSARNSSKKSGNTNSISARNTVAATSQDGVNCRPNIIRKLQRDKVNAIIKGRYDEAKEADVLSKRVTDAVLESVEEDRRYERLRQIEEKLEEEKRTFSEFHKEWIEKVKEEEEVLKSRMNSLEEIHVAELREFENKWNSEDFLRRFSKPSASLLQLKAIERSMVIAKMFDDAKVVKSRAEQLERIETREQQNRAESEMKVERQRLLDRQNREMAGLKEKCNSLLNIVKRNMEREEAPFKARISKLEADLKSGNENKSKMVTSVISPRGGNELLTAKTAFKFSAFKVTTQSMKLKIKPLGSVTMNEKKKSKGSKK